MTELVERVIDRLILDERGCWLWPGSTGKGYGQVRHRGHNVSTHRLLYQFFRDVIPDELEIDHHCEVRNCANPWHMEVVPHRVNVLRGLSVAGVAGRRETCPRGHLYDDFNSEGRRICSECARKGDRDRKRKRYQADSDYRNRVLERNRARARRVREMMRG